MIKLHSFCQSMRISYWRYVRGQLVLCCRSPNFLNFLCSTILHASHESSPNIPRELCLRPLVNASWFCLNTLQEDIGCRWLLTNPQSSSFELNDRRIVNTWYVRLNLGFGYLSWYWRRRIGRIGGTVLRFWSHCRSFCCIGSICWSCSWRHRSGRWSPSVWGLRSRVRGG